MWKLTKFKNTITGVVNMEEKNIQVKCIKDVVMNDDYSVAFIKGNVYNAVSVGYSIRAQNEQGHNSHYINSEDEDLDRWFQEHFEIVTKENNNLTDYVKSLLKDEKGQLEEQIKNTEERMEHRKKQLQFDLESLESAKKKLKDVSKVLYV